MRLHADYPARSSSYSDSGTSQVRISGVRAGGGPTRRSRRYNRPESLTWDRFPTHPSQSFRSNRGTRETDLGAASRGLLRQPEKNELFQSVKRLANCSLGCHGDLKSNLSHGVWAWQHQGPRQFRHFGYKSCRVVIFKPSRITCWRMGDARLIMMDAF
ncbi:unnamed protein product [Boreogadus saida]